MALWKFLVSPNTERPKAFERPTELPWLQDRKKI